MRIETRRLLLRPLEEADFSALQKILGDPRVMYAWEHGFGDAEVRDWITRSRARYAREGAGHLAAIERASGDFVGTIGPVWEPMGDREAWSVGYILRRDRWGERFAREGAAACVRHVLEALGAPEAAADIRPENAASRRVAAALGMEEAGAFVKIYRGREMPHLIYRITKERYESMKRERGNIYAEI